MEISIKRVYQYIVIFLNFYTASNHLHPLQVGNCDSNSRLVVDEDDNGKFRPERVNMFNAICTRTLRTVIKHVKLMIGHTFILCLQGSNLHFVNQRDQACSYFLFEGHGPPTTWF